MISFENRKSQLKTKNYKFTLMELNVSQVKENNQHYVKIERSQDFDDFVWQELLKTIKQFQDTPFK